MTSQSRDWKPHWGQVAFLIPLVQRISKLQETCLHSLPMTVSTLSLRRVYIALLKQFAVPQQVQRYSRATWHAMGIYRHMHSYSLSCPSRISSHKAVCNTLNHCVQQR